AEQTPATVPGNASNIPLSSPSPIQATPPSSPATPSPHAPSPPTGTPEGTGSAPAKSAEKTADRAARTVRFDPADGGTPTQETVKTGTLATPPQHNPQREGFRFDGWMLDGQPYDFQTPILQDTTLKAQWTKTTDWTLSPEHGPATGARLTISPPDRQEPCYTSIQAAGNQIVGLTGDGRIHTWTQEGAPVQVPFPAQAPDGFRYLQAAAGSRRQAALGSDRRIYTWDSRQPAPTLLDTGQDAGFTSISINDDRLLAVDRQGQVHAYQAGQADSQNPNPKPAAQETIGLPGKAQAVLAAASGSRILIVDTDGQAWTWETANAGSAKPSRAEQDPGMRTVQAQALNQGFLLLDADGQARYLDDNTASSATLGLPENRKASRIAANKDQAVITSTDGRIWTWKPGATAIRADNGEQPYTQAAAAGSSITAINRQGDMFTWSLDAQNNPGKPARTDNATGPTMESASMDGQALTLSRKDRSWQTEIPARKPGPAAITLAGRQDGQPFTRSLSYTVDQTLTRNNQQRSTYKVTFNADGGNPEPADQNFSTPNSRVKRPSPDPTREGYQFDGWFTGNIAYDFSKPVTKDLILTAHWTPGTWTINPDKGSQLGGQQTTITPPPGQGIKFNQISGGKDEKNGSSFSLAVGSDGNAYAWGGNVYGQIGDGKTTQQTTPVMVLKPAGVPADFTYVQVSAGYSHSLAVGSDGYVYAWGRNNYGQLGNNATNDSSVPVRVRDPSSPTDENKGLKAIQVSAGAYHSLAIDSDGYVYAWGGNFDGQLGNNTIGDYSTPNPLPVHVRDPSSPTDENKGLKAIQVSAGAFHSIAVGSDGYVYTWGFNYWGQIGNNISGFNKYSSVPVLVQDTDKNKGLKAIQVSAGGDHSLAIDEDGKTWSWGRNDHGELGNGNNDDRAVPGLVRYPGTVTASQVNAGLYHSLAIDEDGNTWSWGDNTAGQLGNDDTSDLSSPVRVLASAQSTSSGGPWLKAVQVSGGWYHSLAIGADGNTEVWGSNQYGELGNPNAGSQSLTPVPVVFNLQPVITGVKFDTGSGTNLTPVSNSNNVTVFTPAHQPGTVTVSVDYTLGGAPQTPDTSLRYTYLPAGVLPQAGGEGILLALATGMTGMGGVLASRRHRRETRRLLHASHE
ncbi:InlB B-repeat-containing protein, partial [Bifidobacterium asteroides]|uniref:RCC1 domain-containing protein n=1 Tax=Bifidobacterium asteroides TaxID=1684 RepID=UPI001E4C6FBA